MNLLSVRIKDLWKRISLIGSFNSRDINFTRRLVLSNQVAVILFLASFLAFLIDVSLCFCPNSSHPLHWANSFRIVALSVLSVIVIFMNYKGWITLAKILLSLATMVTILLLPIVNNLLSTELYLIYPVITIAMSIIPALIFSFYSEKKYLFSILSLFFIFLIFGENFYNLFITDKAIDISIIQENIAGVKLAESVTFLFVVWLIIYLVNSFINTQNQLYQINFELEEHKEEITTQNEILRVKEQGLAEYSRKLERTIAELETTQKELVHSQKMASLGTFTAGLAHEINNPLAFIVNSIENIGESLNEMGSLVKSPNSEDKLLDTIDHSKMILNHANVGAERITDVINGLIQYCDSNAKPNETVLINQLLINTISHYSEEYLNRGQFVLNFEGDINLFCNKTYRYRRLGLPI